MRSSILLFAWLIFVLSRAVVAADDLAVAPVQGFVLLKNGELIAGTITASGDRYDVIDGDTETYIKRGDVEAVCRNAHECYRHKRLIIEAGRAQDHLELAEWCLRNRLIDEARRELADARAADARHPRIALVERRMALLTEQPATTEPATLPSDALRAGNELDQFIRTLPSGAVEYFANSVQPILMNHCTKSGCHGSAGTSSLRLERIGISGLAGRRATQRNLQTALLLVDREHPMASKLLDAPIRPHGPLGSPVFTDLQQSQYRQLVEWVCLIAGTRSRPPALALDERGGPLLQAVPGASGATAMRAAPPGAADDQSGGGVKAVNWSEVFPDHAPMPPGSKPPEANSAEPAVPRAEFQARPQAPLTPARDPFDPDIFNRRYHGD